MLLEKLQINFMWSNYILCKLALDFPISMISAICKLRLDAKFCIINLYNIRLITNGSIYNYILDYILTIACGTKQTHQRDSML